MRQRRGDDVLQREARLGRRARLLVVRDLEPRRGRCRRRRCSMSSGRRFMLLLQRERAVDRGEGVAAARVVLERHARDVEVLAERRRAPFSQSGLSPIARPKPASPSITSSEPVTPSRAASAAVTPASAARPGVQRLRHRVHAERLLQPGGEGRHRRQRMGELARVRVPAASAAAARGAEAADGAGVVPVLVVRAAHRRADARRDLVADDDGAQEVRGRSARARAPRRWSARRGDRCRRGRCRRPPPCAPRCR